MSKGWILNQVARYAKQIGIAEQDMPSVVFTRKEVLAMPKELTAGRRTVTHKCLGICFCGAKTILINVKKHTSFKDLQRTIIHELVHYRFRYLKHSTRFEDRISRILEGKTYKVKVLYAENPPLLISSYSQDHQNILHIHPQQSGCEYTLGFNAETGVLDSRLWRCVV
jgi:hypothetical protein